MEDDPRSAVTRTGDGDLEMLGAQQLPMRRTRPVAQDRIWPRGEHGRHPATVCSHDPVSDHVGAAMDRVQAGALEPVVDRAPSDADLDQLLVRDDAMLPLGKLCDQSVHRFGCG
jgi:hypothetical protein